MTGDPLRDWTDELARNPRSLVFLRLADLLRRRGRVDEATQVVLAGLERHPYHPDAHDVFARILVDSGNEARARDEWEMALRLDASHAGALKGLGFLAYRRGDLPTAARLLALAVDSDPNDQGVAAAQRQVRAQLTPANLTMRPSVVAPNPAPPPAPARVVEGEGTTGGPGALFANLLGDGDRTALLLDRDGLVLAGRWVDARGAESAEEVGAELAGLAGEASRALEQLGLGAWESLLVETQYATVALGPAPDESIVLVAAARDSRLGLVRRLLAQAGRRAAAWLAAA